MGRKRSGKHLLSDIDKKAHYKRSSIKEMNKNITKTQRHIEYLKQEETQTYMQLAEIRLALLENPETKKQISLAEKKATDAITTRQNSEDTLDKSLDQNQSAQNDLEQKRTEYLASIEASYVALKDAEKHIEIELLDDAIHNAFTQDIEQLENTIIRVDNKVILARDDYQEKSIPYYNDELFMYLKKRHYGTSAYTIKLSLIRYLDDKVARLINYEAARRNYTLLHSIPGKLVQHKDLLNKKIESVKLDQKNYKKNYFEQKGISKLQQDYLKQQDSLDRIDQELEILENEHTDIIQRKMDLLNKSDDTENHTVTVLHNIYKSDKLSTLKQYAAMTATQDDDKLVKKLYELDKKISSKEILLSTYQQSLQQERKHLENIQSARKTYKKKRYDVRRTTFEDDDIFSALLTKFLGGLLSKRRFWHAVGDMVEDVIDEIDLD
ncbi:MAG: hypothetical protein ACRBDL_11655 [Alphaproteobacteria bacterium]